MKRKVTNVKPPVRKPETKKEGKGPFKGTPSSGKEMVEKPTSVKIVDTPAPVKKDPWSIPSWMVG